MDKNIFGLSALIFISAIFVSSVEAQTQSLLLPIARTTAYSESSSLINFFDSQNPQIETLPSFAFTIFDQQGAPIWGSPHDETDLANASYPVDPYFLFNEKYLGQHPKWAQKIVYDNNGNLLFFIVDNNIYNRHGLSFPLKTSEQDPGMEYTYLFDGLTSAREQFEYDNGDEIDGAKFNRHVCDISSAQGTKNYAIDPEICIFPINNSHSCRKYGIVFSVYNAGAPSHAGEVFYRTITYYNENTIVLSPLISLSDTYQFIDHIWCNNKSARGLAVYRKEDNSGHLLFVRYNNHIEILNINALGEISTKLNDIPIVDLSIVPGGGEGMQHQYSTELEIIKNEGAFYVAAGTYYVNAQSPCSTFVTILKIDPTNFNLISRNLVCLPNYGINENGFVKGLEFSMDGNKLFITFSGQTDLYYIDLHPTSGNPTLNSIGLTINPPISVCDYQYSQIELGRNGMMYYLHSNESGSIGGISELNPIDNSWREIFPETSQKIYFSHAYENYGTTLPTKCLLFEDQMDGIYNSLDFTSQNSWCCNNHIYYSDWPEDGYFTASMLWAPGTGNSPFPCINGIVWINQDVVIPANKTLTIKDMTFKFAGNKKLIINTGAKLILDHSTLSSVHDCELNTLWGGIEIYGTSNADQFTPGVQGTLEMINGSCIENAICGVAAGTSDNTGALLLNGGGIIKATGATFVNCIEAVKYAPFKNMVSQDEKPNLGRFVNCQFKTTDDLYALHNQIPQSFINIKGVSGLIFRGCDFLNISTQTGQFRGIGIKSADAQYEVCGYCPFAQIPCSGFDSCRFKYLQYGILAQNAASANAVNIRNTRFVDNFRGVGLFGIANAVITGNTFDVGENHGPETQLHHYDSYALYFEGCRNYTIKENEFTTTHWGRYGVIIANSGKNDELISNNSFSNFKYALQAEGRNGSSIAFNGSVNMDRGLLIKCNDFTNQQFSDVSLVHFTNPNSTITQGRIKRNQGECTNTATPAGNQFDPGHIHNLYSKTGVKSYVYKYHNTGAQTEPTLNNSTLITKAACPLPFTSSSCNTNTSSRNKDEIISSITSISEEINNFLMLFDGGKTSDLLDIIFSSGYSSAEIRDNLLNASPLLTDTVLIAAIHSEYLKQNDLSTVIIANSSLSDRVLDEIKLIDLPSDIREAILIAQNGTSARMDLEKQIEDLNRDLMATASELIQWFKSDTNSTGSLELGSILATIPNSEIKKTAAESQYLAGDCINLSAILNEIPQSTPDDQNFVKFFSVLQELCESGLPVNEMSAEQFQYIQEVAASNTEVSINARALLATIADSSLKETIEDITISDTLSIRGYLFENTDCGTTPVSGDTLIIKDIHGNILDEITPVSTASNGWFGFNAAELSLLDDSTLITIDSKGSFTIDTALFLTIDAWIHNSPIQLNHNRVSKVWESSVNLQSTLNSSGDLININTGIFTAGTIQNANGDNDIVLIHNEPTGDTVWTAQYNSGPASDDIAADIYSDTLKHIYISGSIGMESAHDISVIKYDSTGILSWATSYDQNNFDDRAVAMTQDYYGNILVLGSVSISEEFKSVIVIKYDTSGNLVWSYLVDNTSSLSPVNIITGRDNSVVISATDQGTSATSYIFQLDSCGNLVNSIDIPDFDACDFVTDSAENIYIAGENSLQSSALIIKFDQYLNTIWSFETKGILNYSPRSNYIKQDSAGNILFLSQTKMGFKISMLNSEGLCLWNIENRGGWEELLRNIDMATDKLGNIYIAATADYFENRITNYGHIFKYSPGGNLIWSQQESHNTISDIAVSDNMNIYTSGSVIYYNYEEPLQKLVTRKYSQCFGNINLRSIEFEAPQDSACSFNLYPNPNNGTMEITYTFPLEDEGIMAIFDQTGRVVFKKELSGGSKQMSIQLEGLNSGVYYYKAYTTRQRLGCDRIVIIR